MIDTRDRVRNQRRRFTAIEVIAMLVVIGVLSAVAVASVRGGTVALHTEEGLLRSHLRYAQSRAMADTGGVWSVEITSTGYSLRRDGAISSLPWPGEDSATHTFTHGIRVTAGTGSVAYGHWGSPGTADRTIVLSLGTDTTEIKVLGVTGFVR